MITLAWHTGAFAGLAFAGKLPDLKKVLDELDKPPPESKESIDGLKELAKSKGFRGPW